MAKVVAEHGVQAYEFLDQGSERSEIYGTISETIHNGIQDYGVDLALRPQHLGGFTRLQAD